MAKFIHKGISATLREHSRRHGLPELLVCQRLGRGWTLAQALTTAVRHRAAPVTITFQGKTLSPPKWAQRTGISADIIRARLVAGWTPEEILTTLPGLDRGEKPPYDPFHLLRFAGRNWTLRKWAKLCNVDQAILGERVFLEWPTIRVLMVEPANARMALTHRADQFANLGYRQLDKFGTCDEMECRRSERCNDDGKDRPTPNAREVRIPRIPLLGEDA